MLRPDRNTRLIVIVGLVMVLLALVGSQIAGRSASGDITILDDRLPGVQMLSEEALREIALEIAKGHRSNADAELTFDQPIYALYRDLVAFEGDDPEPEPGMLGAENAYRPIMVVTISGDEFRPRFIHPEPPETPASVTRYTSMVIILFADTGQISGTGFAPEGVVLDYSALPGYASAPLPPTSPELIPLPSVPDPNQDMRGTS